MYVTRNVARGVQGCLIIWRSGQVPACCQFFWSRFSHIHSFHLCLPYFSRYTFFTSCFTILFPGTLFSLFIFTPLFPGTLFSHIFSLCFSLCFSGYTFFTLFFHYFFQVHFFHTFFSHCFSLFFFRVHLFHTVFSLFFSRYTFFSDFKRVKKVYPYEENNQN